MAKRKLNNVTMFGISTDNFYTLQKAARVCLDYIDFEEVVLLSRNEIDYVHNIHDYNKFMIRDLSKYVNTDYVLTMQYDGFILNPDAWNDEFYDYDYIGAPWKFDAHWLTVDNKVGNGGFSFRSKKLIDRVATLPYTIEAEDIFISINSYKTLVDEGFKFAPFDVANRFSMEIGEWDGQFGFHSLALTNLNKWKDKNKYNF